MLVLTRKTGQKLIIADNIEVVILETKGDAVKIGIKAPKNVTIYREEIYEEIKKANELASKNAVLSDFDNALNLFDNKKQNFGNYLNQYKPTINLADKKPSE